MFRFRWSLKSHRKTIQRFPYRWYRSIHQTFRWSCQTFRWRRNRTFHLSCLTFQLSRWFHRTFQYRMNPTFHWTRSDLTFRWNRSDRMFHSNRLRHRWRFRLG